MDSIRVTNFIHLNSDERDMVLCWRNDLSVRRFMVNKDTITSAEHASFIEKLKVDKSKAYYLVEARNEVMSGGGVIYLSYINDDATEIGLYKSPLTRLSRMGCLLMDLIFAIAGNERLTLKVLKDNERAVSLYKLYEFCMVEEDDIFYYMETRLTRVKTAPPPERPYLAVVVFVPFSITWRRRKCG